MCAGIGGDRVHIPTREAAVMEPQSDRDPSADRGSPTAAGAPEAVNAPCPEKGWPGASATLPRLTPQRRALVMYPQGPSVICTTERAPLPPLDKDEEPPAEPDFVPLTRSPKQTSLLGYLHPAEESQPELDKEKDLEPPPQPPEAQEGAKVPEAAQKAEEKTSPPCPKPGVALPSKFSSPEQPGPGGKQQTPLDSESGLSTRVIYSLDPESHDAAGLAAEPSVCPFRLTPREEQVEPPDNVRPVYLGKYFDRNPGWPTAGKLNPVGYRAENCLTEKWPPPVTPPNERKFYKSRYPDPGTERIFHGRANDPDVSNLIHGRKYDMSLKMSHLINPLPITTFQQRFKETKESIYLSNRRAPLGRSHDQTQNLPEYVDTVYTTFGAQNIRDTTAGEVVNPPKSSKQVSEEADEGHDLYIISHNDYYAGEKKNRKYNPESFSRCHIFGGITPHFNDGRVAAKSLRWLHELEMKKGSKIVSKRLDDFNEKFQHKLGKVWDPIAETMNLPPNHTFGALLRPDNYGAADVIYNRLPDHFQRGKERQQAVLAAIRQHLKKVNYHNFDSLLAAFRHFDVNADGMIDKEELRRACSQMNLELNEVLLNELFDYCDLDGDGMINYQEFANFLNWKDLMPINEFEEKILLTGRKVSEDPEQQLAPGEESADKSVPLIKPEDIVQEQPGKEMKTPRTLTRPTDKVFADYKTTSSQINSVVGGISPKNFKKQNKTKLEAFCCKIIRTPEAENLLGYPEFGCEGFVQFWKKKSGMDLLLGYYGILVSILLMRTLNLCGIWLLRNITKEKFV
ncbi:EF-hand domain-containing family member B isoform X2 [Sminthopsis crassicaudata]|uniref:EF-hand domain-containing family member B isoform X2 n=1 Tax=Sminthopsis crassicaudata TaxID=9301 RepID=UPI003D69D816